MGSIAKKKGRGNTRIAEKPLSARAKSDLERELHRLENAVKSKELPGRYRKRPAAMSSRIKALEEATGKKSR